jgi:hypothetical protein
MPEISDQNVEQFVVEPVTQLDGSPVTAAGRVRAADLRQKLEQPGMIALVAGLALAFCFFMPWLSLPHFAGPSGRFFALPYSGWDTAIGLPEGSNFRLAVFAHLWLVPLAALTLLVVAWLYSHRRITARLALGCVLALSVLALLVELGFYWQIASLNAIDAGARGVDIPSYAVLWGCWLAMCVNVVVGAACIFLRPDLFSHKAEQETGGLGG